MSERVDQEMLETLIKDRGERSMCPMHVEDCLIELKFLRRMEQEVRTTLANMDSQRFPSGEFNDGRQAATHYWADELRESLAGVDDELLAMSIDA